MEPESNAMPQCRSGCGFYGNPSQDGLCSVCYKDFLRKKQQPPVSSTPSSNNGPQPPASGQSVTASAVSLRSVVVTQQSLANSISNASSSSTTTTSASSASAASSSPAPSTCAAAANNPAVAVTNTAQPTVHSSLFCSDKDKLNTDDSGHSNNSSIADNDDKDGDKDDSKKKKNRCATCRKKVGLTGFECRCGGLFCAIHRYSDKHECSFDYRELGAAEIRRNNPVVVGEKIQKI